MKTIFLSLIVFFAIGNAPCKAQDFTLNKNESSLQWTGKSAFNSYAPTGTLQVSNGQLKFTDNTLMELEVIIDMKSLYHENNRLKTHLRDKDFFHVKRYQTAVFRLEQPTTLSSSNLILQGTMTIKSTEKNESIPVTFSKLNDTIILTFDHTFDRTQYGITYNSPNVFKNLKDNAIADDFQLKGKLVFQAD